MSTLPDRTWPKDSWPTAEQYQGWLAVLTAPQQVEALTPLIEASIKASDMLSQGADDLESGALIERSALVTLLRDWAAERFATSGPLDHRGAALWDVAAFLAESKWPAETTAKETP